MKNRRNPLNPIVLLIIFALFIFTQSLMRKERFPEAPEGYAWKKSKDMRAGFLVPEGWFFREKRDDDTQTVFITKSPTDKNEVFTVGFSINAIQDANKKAGMPPSLFAKNIIDQLKLASKSSSSINAVGDGSGFSGFGGFFLSETEDREFIYQFILALGNDNTGTLYIITFASPGVEWGDAWKTGRPIVDNLMLEPEF